MLSRDKLKQQEEKLKKSADSFIEGAEPQPAKRGPGRPVENKEKRGAVPLSLTKTETSKLDGVPKRINYLAYSQGEEINLNRSDLVRMCTTFLNGMSDEELIEWYHSNKDK